MVVFLYITVNCSLVFLVVMPSQSQYVTVVAKPIILSSFCRFYMFSRRDPQEEDGGENGRDVFNEKPSVEEVSMQGLTALLTWETRF